MTKPKILIWDLETLPNICYAYDLYSYKKPDMIIQEKSIATFAYKWLGEKETHVISIVDYYGNGASFNPYDDSDLVQDIVDIYNEADYTVAHFGDKFDNRFLRARALINGIEPPAQTPSIDTYKLAKKYFHLNANRLDYLGKVLKVGRKISTSWKLWEKCAEGSVRAFKEMAKYNKQDVALLEKVFLKMLPYCNTRLNHQLFHHTEEGLVCESCGSNKVQRRGRIANKTILRQRWHCQKCGAWFSTKLKKEK